MSYHIYNTEGFVIKGFNVGEANKYFYLFTKDFGLIKASAQNIRSSSSKLKFGLQEMSYSGFVFINSKSFWKITNINSIKNYYYIFEDNFEKIKIINNIFLLIKKMVPEDEKNEELFNLIRQSFNFLEANLLEKEEIYFFELILLIKIMHNLGYLENQGNKFMYFLENDWDESLIENAKNLKSDMVLEVNQSIKESMLY